MVQMKKLAWASMMIVALCAISIDAQTTAPTKSPTTSKPTASPTTFPTKAPTTSKPTKSPTEAPTGTEAPTKSPTTSPTKAPTVAPTTSAPVTKAPVLNINPGLNPNLPANADTCATYKNRLDDGTIGMCADLVDYPYFLPRGATQENLEAKAFDLVNSNPAAPILLAIVPGTCAMQLKKTVCASVFQRCNLVDPFFLDFCTTSSCTVVNPTTQTSICAADQDPATGGPKACATAPGRVVGANVTWAFAASVAGPGFTPVPLNIFCNAAGLVLNGTVCKKAIPITQNKAVCDKLHSISNPLASGCPIVGGLFGSTHIAAAFNPAPIDPDRKAEAQAELTTNFVGGIGAGSCTHNSPNFAAVQCSTEVLFNANLLAILNVLPNCNQLLPNSTFYAFSKGTRGTQFDLPGLARGGDFVFVGQTACFKALGAGHIAPDTPAVQVGDFSCQDYFATAPFHTTVNPTLLPNAGVAPGTDVSNFFSTTTSIDSKSIVASASVAFADELKNTTEDADGTTERINPICETILKSDVNQPLDPTELLILTASQGRVPSVALGKGAFFVSGALGLPPLPARLSFSTAGTNPTSPFNRFTNQPLTHTRANNTVIDTPLCQIGSKKVNGTNSLECLLAQVNIGVNILPKWVNPSCRTALQELVCTSGLLKPELKTMCFVPRNLGVGFADFTPNCGSPLTGATNFIQKRGGFTFALPRFANNAVCKKASDACKPFVTFLEEANPALATTLGKALDCEQKINVTCDDNKAWTSFVWPREKACGSPFNGLTRYPAVEALLANITSLGGATLAAYRALANAPQAGGLLYDVSGVQDDLGRTNSIAAVQNFSESELLSQISCPAPLSPVDALPAPGADLEFLGCADVCTTSMFSSEDNQKVYKLEFNMAAASIVGCALVLIGSIVMHRPGYIMILFTFMILGLSIVFLITNSGANYEELWCEDAQTPKNQADGGLCQLQAVGFVFFSLAACGFWFAASVEVFVKAFYKRDVPVWWPLFHAFGGACLFVIIMGATNSQGYKGPNMFCVATEEGAGIENAEYLLFFAPVAIQAIVGTIILMIGLVKAVCTGFFFPNQKVQVVFCLTFALLFLIFGLGSLLNALLAEPVTEGAKAWIGCLLNNFNDEITDPATDPKANLTSLNAELVALEVKPRADGSGCGANFPVTFNLSQVEVALAAMLLQGVALVVVLWPAILFPKIAVEGDSGADEGKLTVRA